MAQFKNKVYSNTSKGSSVKDTEGFYYHYTQQKKQDRLIEEWLESKGKKIKLTNTKGWRARS